MILFNNNPTKELLFRKPSSKDYIELKQLFDNPFYRFVKSNKNNRQFYIINKAISGHDDLNLNEFNFLAYTKEQQFIGYIKGFHSISGSILWIQILVVDKPFVRQGYGKLIIRETVQSLLQQKSLNNLYLTCHKDNSIGMNFWKTLGFKHMTDIKDTYSLMEANLRSLTCIPNHLKP